MLALIKSKSNEVLEWVKWGTGALLTLALAALVLDYFGARMPWIPTGSEVTLAYLAGAYWLTK